MIVLAEILNQILEITAGILRNTFEVIVWLWWIPFVVLYFYLRALKRQSRSIKNFDWKLLEIRVPKENIKTPKAMEQVLASLYSMHSSVHWEEVWLKGDVHAWMSLEIAGSEKGIHFYIYIPSKFRNLVEASFFSQYPEAEIIEVEDYTKKLPNNLPNEEYDLIGVDLYLANKNPYPIRTYPYFLEGGSSPKEEKRTESISNLTEIMPILKGEERVWVQILIRPSEKGWDEQKNYEDWTKEGQKIINEIIAGGYKKKKKPSSWLNNLADECFMFLRNLVMAFFESPVWPEKEKDGGDKAVPLMLSPIEQDMVKAIENKISKLGYVTVVRFLLINKKSELNKKNLSLMMGAFRQFTDNNLNRLKPVSRTSTFATPRFLFKKSTVLEKKKAIFKKYINRSYPDSDHDFFSFKPSVLNIEEIATLYHFPFSSLVEVSGLSQLPIKKSAPPSNLPVGE